MGPHGDRRVRRLGCLRRDRRTGRGPRLPEAGHRPHAPGARRSLGRAARTLHRPTLVERDPHRRPRVLRTRRVYEHQDPVPRSSSHSTPRERRGVAASFPTAAHSPARAPCPLRNGQRETCCSANRSTAREPAAPGNGYSRRRSVTLPAPDSALRSRFPVCRVRRAARMVRCRSMSPAARTSWLKTLPRRSRAAGRVLRGAPVSAVTHAQRRKTGSQPDGRGGGRRAIRL